MDVIFFEILAGFALFIGVMMGAPMIVFQIPYTAIGVILFTCVSILTLRACNRAVIKFDPNYLIGTMITTLIVGLVGGGISFLLLSFRFFENISFFGPPSFLLNTCLGAITYWCIRLRDTYPLIGFFALFGVGFFFTWSLFTSLVIFLMTLFI